MISHGIYQTLESDDGLNTCRMLILSDRTDRKDKVSILANTWEMCKIEVGE